MSGATKRFGVIGDPIAQSKSPDLHSAWFRKYGISAIYERVRVPADADFTAHLKTFADSGYDGFNITSPHKHSALEAAVEASDIAVRVGAANTLTLHKDGTWSADNTDVQGFSDLMDHAFPKGLPDGPGLIVGAGGAARAVAYWASTTGRAFTIANRTLARAEALANELLPDQAHCIGLEDLARHAKDAAFVINTSAAGHSSVALELGPGQGRTLIDISYGQAAHIVLGPARADGWVIHDGRVMLVGQARAAFHIWHGLWPDMQTGLDVMAASGAQT